MRKDAQSTDHFMAKSFHNSTTVVCIKQSLQHIACAHLNDIPFISSLTGCDPAAFPILTYRACAKANHFRKIKHHFSLDTKSHSQIEIKPKLSLQSRKHHSSTMRSFVLMLFLAAVMRCEGTQDAKGTGQLTPQAQDLAPQLCGGEDVSNGDEVPQLLDTVSNLSGEEIHEEESGRGTEEVSLDSLHFIRFLF